MHSKPPQASVSAHSTIRRFSASRLPATLALLAGFYLTASAQVEFQKTSDRINVTIDGAPFTSLHFGKTENKPFLQPLLTPSGKNVLRGFPSAALPGEATDRPHQCGLWVGCETVTGPDGKVDFWENDPRYPGEGKGRIVMKRLIEASGGKESGRLAIEAHWLSPKGKVLVVERRTHTFHANPKNCRMFDVSIELEAAEAITFEDNQDSIIGMRLALPFDDHLDGKVVNETGVSGEAVRGLRSRWMDWTAELDPRTYATTTHGTGEKIGVAIFGHPTNLNFPARWQIRSMGVMFITPFGGTCFEKFDPKARSAAHSMKRGERLSFRYRVLIHPADVGIAPFFKEWSEQK